MGLISKIKIKAGNYFLNGEVIRHRKVEASNWQSAKSIGIIYRIDDERSFKHIRWYIKELKKRYGSKRIFALGYSDEKNAPAYLSHGLEFDYFIKKDLNWYGKPRSKSSDSFTSEQFDMLIDFTDGSCVPLRFVLLTSRATFKIGRYAKNNEEIYDLLISLEDDSWNHFMEQLDKYVGMIRHADKAG